MKTKGICSKCGIIICDKNKAPQCVTKCKSCLNNYVKYCCYNYSDPILDELSIKNSKQINSIVGTRKRSNIKIKRKGICFKCGVTICDKNKTYDNSPTQCKHCQLKMKTCRIIYPLEINIKISKDAVRKRIIKLSDSVVKEYLYHNGFKRGTITPKMIEIKRKQLLIKRKLKNQKV